MSDPGQSHARAAQPGGRSRAAAWSTFLSELDGWIAEHGDAGVPQTAVGRDVEGAPYPLGVKVKTYRSRYRRGVLSADRVRELEARPGWSWDGNAARATVRWETRFAAVRAYVAAHGSLDGLDAADAPLGRWLRAQRRAQLSAAQRRQLGRIPGALSDRKGRLQDFLEAARSWIAAEPGRDASKIQFSTVHRVARHSIPLGRRVAYWRGRHAAGLLAPGEAAAIAALPGWSWEPPTRREASSK